MIGVNKLLQVATVLQGWFYSLSVYYNAKVFSKQFNKQNFGTVMFSLVENLSLFILWDKHSKNSEMTSVLRFCFQTYIATKSSCFRELFSLLLSFGYI